MRFIGTTIVEATEMTRLEYNKHRGWTLPDDENGDDKGFLLNHESGHVNWMPEIEFCNGVYRPTEGMTFGGAIEALKQGYKVARKGWNGKGMWLCLMPELYLENEKVNGRTLKHIGDSDLDCRPYIVMWNASQQWQPGWNASQPDMLADDWEIVN